MRISDERLDKLRSNRVPVRVRREYRDSVDGFIVGIGRKWLLLGTLDPAYRADGYMAIRRREVVGLQWDKSARRMVHQLKDLDPHRFDVAQAPVINLDRTRELIAGLADLYPLVVLHVEDADPDRVFIGRPQRFGKRTFLMQEVGADGRWHGPDPEDWSEWAYGGVTCVEAGTAYDAAVTTVAGPPPARPAQT